MDSLEKRMKKYALYLLGRRAYSTSEMREKVMQKIKIIDKVRKVHKVYKEQNVNSFNSSVIPPSHSEAQQSEGWGMIRDPEIIIEKVIEYLTNLKLINDEEFAKSFADSLLRQNKSRGVIERKLMQKGINKEMIDRVLGHDEDRESEILKKLIESKTRHHPELLTTPKGKQKLIRFLMYRGFKYNQIKKMITQL
ncbi:MAG: regulatory protein RecX [Patescibacteria group bacterium]